MQKFHEQEKNMHREHLQSQLMESFQQICRLQEYIIKKQCQNLPKKKQQAKI